jgi:hypothetical protein
LNFFIGQPTIEPSSLEAASYMSSGVSLNGPNQVLLRWSDNPGAPSHEQFVQMIESHSSEAVIRSAFKLGEKTEVHLIGRFYTANGIVRSCREDGSEFIVTIFMLKNVLSPDSGSRPPREPGLISVDNWLTEEAENRILEEFEDGSTRNGLRSQIDSLIRAINLLKLQSFHISVGLVKIIRDLQSFHITFSRYMERISCPIQIFG